MGKPTLLFRNETERQEGLGTTAIISRLDPRVISNFVNNYKKYNRSSTFDKKLHPSAVIVDFLQENGFGR